MEVTFASPGAADHEGPRPGAVVRRSAAAMRLLGEQAVEGLAGRPDGRHGLLDLRGAAGRPDLAGGQMQLLDLGPQILVL